MRYRSLIVILAAGIMAGCTESTDLGPGDVSYIRTTVDLLRTRSMLPAGTDSVSVKRTLDSVYARHHTSATAYNSASTALANDPPKAQKIMEAIRDSVKSMK